MDLPEKLLNQVQEENGYSSDQKQELITECWNMLSEDMQQAFINQLDQNQTGKIIINGKELEGVNQFINSMKRLQNSFKPDNINDALDNFKNLDKSKYSLSSSLFNTEILIEKLNQNPLLKTNSATAAGIATQLATLTTDSPIQDQEKFHEITANIISGLVKSNSMFGSSLSSNIVDKYGRISPDLIITVGKYVKENYETLKDLPADKLIKKGQEIKNAWKKNKNLAAFKTKEPLMIDVDSKSAPPTPPVTPIASPTSNKERFI